MRTRDGVGGSMSPAEGRATARPLRVRDPTSFDAGTLGGKGIVAGTVTAGTGSGSGAFLAPSVGASQPAKLTIQSALTIKADSTSTRA